MTSNISSISPRNITSFWLHVFGQNCDIRIDSIGYQLPNRERVVMVIIIRHVNNIPTMQFFSGISRNILSKSSGLSSLEHAFEIWKNSLWKTRYTHYFWKHVSFIAQNGWYISSKNMLIREQNRFVHIVLNFSRSVYNHVQNRLWECNGLVQCSLQSLSLILNILFSIKVNLVAPCQLNCLTSKPYEHLKRPSYQDYVVRLLNCLCC